MTPRISERQIQNYVKAQLTFHGWTVIDTHGPWNRPAHEGITDLIVVKYGYTAWIECKRPTWKPCPDENVMSKTEQSERRFKEVIKAAGATYALIKTEQEADEDIARLNAKAERYRRLFR